MDETKEAVLIDPACYYADEEDTLGHFVEKEKLKIVALLNTHGHFDHLMGNRFAEEKWGLKCRMHPGDQQLATQAKQQAMLFGITMINPNDAEALKPEEVIQFGKSRLKVIHVPGHSPGSVAFFSEEDNLLVSGDILFEGSVGKDRPAGRKSCAIDLWYQRKIADPG